MQLTNHATHVLQSSRAEQKVEVVIEQQGVGAEQLVLRSSTWVDGLGWCVQKTIRLDGDQLEDLQRAVTVARHRLNRQRDETGQAIGQAQIIQMPSLA